jgi:hypothetical protein
VERLYPKPLDDRSPSHQRHEVKPLHLEVRLNKLYNDAQILSE